MARADRIFVLGFCFAFLQRVHCAVEPSQNSNLDRQLQWTAAGMSSLYEDDGCQCKDPKGGWECYNPVCPDGYYKCCFNCEVSLCAEGETKINNLVLSYRGVFECLKCKPGDFCPGCDQYAECPPEMRTGDRGTQKPTPKISAAGSVEERDCKRCPFDYEASLERDRCVNPWRDACNVYRMEVCVAGCKPHNGDECERMACLLYCANQQSKKCLWAFKDDCETLNMPNQQAEETQSSTADDGSSTSEEDEEPLILSDDDGKAEYYPPRSDRPCNLECSNAAGLQIGTVVIAVLTLLHI